MSTIQRIEPGELYEDCAGHPCICVERGPSDDEDAIRGISLIDGSLKRRPTDRGVVQITVQNAWKLKRKIQQLPPSSWVNRPLVKVSGDQEFKPGDIYEDCFYHPCVCVECSPPDDEDGIWGVSLIDGSFPRNCSLTHCGVVKMTIEEAWANKRKFSQDPK